jgi:hypothetical protein
MFCHHCGIKVEGEHLYCPNCGERLPSRNDKKKWPLWLRLLGGVALIALVISFFFFLIEPDPKNTILDQLRALKSRQLTEAYYGFTTRDFQEATSLEKFKEVIRSFPYLSEVKSIEVLDKEEQDAVATLKVAVTTQKGASFVMEYQLAKDEGKWKIVYFKLMRAPQAFESAAIDREEVIRDLLKLLKTHEIKEAYASTTSEAFRETTSLEQFQAFVDSIPLLANYQSYFPQKMEAVGDKEKGVYILKSDKEEKRIEFSLAEENGAWKVLGIKLLPDNGVIKSSQLYVQLVEDFLHTIQKGDFEGAWRQYTSASFQRASPLESFKKVALTYPFIKDYQQLEVLNLTVREDFATLKANLKAKSGAQGNVQFDFISENQVWKIQQILIFKE